MAVVAAAPDWASALTAIGTVAVAVVAVGVALFTERRASARLQKERDFARDREQLAEAYRVQVILKKRAKGGPGTRRLVAYVVNHGGQTITEVDARFTPDGQILAEPPEPQRVRGQRVPPPPIVARMSGESVEVTSHGDRLTPFDAGLQFATGDIDERQLTKPGVIVRWTDQWETRWENKYGVVRKIDKDADWKP